MFEFEKDKYGFKVKVINHDETIRGERGYFRVSLPIQLLLDMNQTNYYGSEEILPGEILFFVDENKKTKFEDGYFSISDMSKCLVNFRGMDIASFIGTYGHLHNGHYTPIDFVEVNIFLVRREEKIINNDIQIVETE